MATYTALGTASGSAGNLALTTGADSPAGNTIEVVTFDNLPTSGAPTLIDSAGNAYVVDERAATVKASSSGKLQVWRCPNALHLPLGGTITYHAGGSRTQVIAFLATSVGGLGPTAPLDVIAVSDDTTTSPTTTTGFPFGGPEFVWGVIAVTTPSSATVPTLTAGPGGAWTTGQTVHNNNAGGNDSLDLYEFYQTPTDTSGLQYTLTGTLSGTGGAWIALAVVYSNQTATTQTVTAKGSINTQTSRDIAAIARMRATATQNIGAKAHIGVSTARNVNAKGDVRNTSAQQATAKADVRATTAQPIGAKANLAGTTTQPIGAKGNVQTGTTRNVNAKARMQNVANQLMNAKAAVRVTQAQTITAVARIGGVVLLPPFQSQLVSAATYDTAGAGTPQYDAGLRTTPTYQTTAKVL